jgi:hypothetical protein
MKRSFLAAFAVSVGLFLAAGPAPSRAEEGGSAHYMPGGSASFIDALPGKPGPAVVSLFLAYDASTSLALPIAGLEAANIDATVYAENIAIIYQTDKHLLGGSYAGGLVLPLLDMKVKGSILTTNGALQKTDNETGFGDMLFYPFMLGWTALGGDLKYDVRLGIYAPTGEYHAGKLANLGRNYWTFEPTVTLSWLSSKIGTEASLFTAFDINTENTATDYESGTSWHVDATLAQHLPLFGGFIGAGAQGFSYLQITGDSGAGAVLGGFKGHTVGIGPVISYIYVHDKTTLAAEFKWLPELDVDKRLEGDYFWLKLAAAW